MVFLSLLWADPVEMGELLGWMQAFFEQLGIWSTMTTALTISIILSLSGLVIKFVAGNR